MRRKGRTKFLPFLMKKESLGKGVTGPPQFGGAPLGGNSVSPCGNTFSNQEKVLVPKVAVGRSALRCTHVQTPFPPSAGLTASLLKGKP